MTTFERQTVTETMDDDQLVLLARQGCEQAFSLIVRRFTPLIKQQATLFKSIQHETEDLAQEGMLGLLSAVRTYKECSASFRTYASVCVRNRMLTVIKQSGGVRKIPQYEIISIEEQRDLCVPLSHFDPAQIIIQKEDTTRLKGWLKGLLSSKEYEVLMLYLMSCAYKDIAEHLGMSVKAVDNSLQRVRRKLVTVSFPGG